MGVNLARRVISNLILSTIHLLDRREDCNSKARGHGRAVLICRNIVQVSFNSIQMRAVLSGVNPVTIKNKELHFL